MVRKHQRTHFQQVRAEQFPYKRNPPYPYQRLGLWGPWQQDAVSMAWFPQVQAVQSYSGIVNGSDGATNDIGYDQHDMAVTMRGALQVSRNTPE